MKRASSEKTLLKGKWQRREKKRRPKMAVHGRGMKKLASHLNSTYQKSK